MITTLFVTTAVVAISILLLVINNKKRKPKKFPSGPFVLPLIGSVYALGTEPHKTLSALKNKYGNVIGIYFGSYRAIVLNDFDTITKAYSLREIDHRPKFEVTSLIRGKNRTGVVWSSGKTNEEQRAFLVKTLKSFGMGKKTMEILLQDQLGKLFGTLDMFAGKVVMNEELFNTSAISALWTIVSGDNENDNDESFKNILAATRKVAQGTNNYVYFFPTLSKLFPNISGWNNMVQYSLEQNMFVSNAIESHRDFLKSRENEPRDVIDAFLKKIDATNDEKSSFYGKHGEENLLSCMVDLLQAGTETISTALTWLLSILIRHPDVQQNMYSEIIKVIGQNRLPALSDRSQLPYIEAVIFELLRYSALVPMSAPHETSEDVVINGFLIPKNTIVIPNIYDALHDPLHWEEPETFKPERFLKKDGSEILRNVSSKAELIFGHGRRICPGEALAKDELFLFVTGLCQRYEFLPDPNSPLDQEIKTDNAVTLLPKPHTLIINKR